MTHAHGGDLRRGRFSEAGRIYLVTTVTHERRPLFRDFTYARTLIRCLREINDLGSVDTQCFVVMPDHLHWLFDLGEAVSLGRVMQSMKSFSARRLNALQGVTGKVWQAGFHDHALRSEEDVRRVARYVVANPLRAGLVMHLGDFPWWDARWL